MIEYAHFPEILTHLLPLNTIKDLALIYEAFYYLPYAPVYLDQAQIQLVLLEYLAVNIAFIFQQLYLT